MSINERDLGETVAVSIGTAMALEVIVGPSYVNVDDYIFMNVKTLWRNFAGSIEDEHEESIPEMAQMFIDECENIKSLLDGILKVVMYTTDSKYLGRTFKRATIKTAKTDRQKHDLSLEEAIFNILAKDLIWETFQHYKLKIPGESVKALIITSHPLDLISAPKFRKLTLLESHTGALKSKKDWFRKLNKSDKWAGMPFNILFIQLLGDNNTQFRSMGKKAVRELHEIAIADGWNSSTTNEKIKYGLKKMKDKLHSEILLEMIRVKLP